MLKANNEITRINEETEHEKIIDKKEKEKAKEIANYHELSQIEGKKQSVIRNNYV